MYILGVFVCIYIDLFGEIFFIEKIVKFKFLIVWGVNYGEGEK